MRQLPRYRIASSLSVTSADGGRVVALVAFGNVIVAAVRFGGDAAEYEAAKQAIREKGARLRALRLARDAAKQRAGSKSIACFRAAKLIAFQVARIVPQVRNLKAGAIPRRAPPWPPSGTQRRQPVNNNTDMRIAPGPNIR